MNEKELSERVNVVVERANALIGEANGFVEKYYETGGDGHWENYNRKMKTVMGMLDALSILTGKKYSIGEDDMVCVK